MKRTQMNFSEIRNKFWTEHPQFTRKGRTKQNDYNTDIRVYFCDFIEHLRRNGEITETQAKNITL